MMIEGENGQLSTLKNVLSVCNRFLLTRDEAYEIIAHQLQVVDHYFISLCDEAQLDKREQDRLLGSVIKSDFCLVGF